MVLGTTRKSAGWKRTLTVAIAALGSCLLASPAFAQSSSRIPSDPAVGQNGAGMDTPPCSARGGLEGFFYVNGSDVLVHNKFSFGLILDWGHALMRTSGTEGERVGNPVGNDGLPCTRTTGNCLPNPASGGTAHQQPRRQQLSGHD